MTVLSLSSATLSPPFVKIATHKTTSCIICSIGRIVTPSMLKETPQSATQGEANNKASKHFTFGARGRTHRTNLKFSATKGLAP
jgi:hypothetical protein